jgi:hypothetical protein
MRVSTIKRSTIRTKSFFYSTRLGGIIIFGSSKDTALNSLICLFDAGFSL